MFGGLKRYFRFLNLVCVAFLIAAFIFLAIRASDEYRWSDWGFGDAQTMLSVKQWDEGGWIENYLLFIPQGYANVVHLLDRPELRQHAHGTCPGSAPGVGPRLWYTHYPAGYLIPYALLFKTGLNDIFSNRMLSLVMSFGALLLMYAMLAKMSGRMIALIAVVFYTLSKPFLGFADTLANQPIDDLLRFYFMFALVMSTRGAVERRKFWLISAWVAEFGLSLCSFDSVFFVYVWLVGWDILERKTFDWKKYLLFGMAPLTAHGLQFLQNVWYLGFDTAVLDIKVTFMLKSGQDMNYNMQQTRLSVTIEALKLITAAYFNSLQPFFALCAAYLGFTLFLRKKDDKVMPSLLIMLLLFLSGLSFVLVLPHAARMPYEARQMAPFFAVLVAATAWSAFRAIGYVFLRPAGEKLHLIKKTLLFGYAAAAAVVVVYSVSAFDEVDRKPLYSVPPDNLDPRAASVDPAMAYLFQFKDDILFAKQLRNMVTPKNPVFFDLDGFRTFWDPQYVPGYPQINPIIEFYAGSKPVLCFTSTDKLEKDLVALLECSGKNFSPVITTRSEPLLREIIANLVRNGRLKGPPPAVSPLMGRLVVDLSGQL